MDKIKKKDRSIFIRISQEEYELIQSRMEMFGINNMSSFIRKLSIDGYLIRVQLDDLSEIRRLLRICSNNLNQYAKKANGTDCIYYNDIVDLQIRLNEIWEMFGTVLEKIAKI